MYSRVSFPQPKVKIKLQRQLNPISYLLPKRNQTQARGGEGVAQGVAQEKSRKYLELYFKLFNFPSKYLSPSIPSNMEHYIRQQSTATNAEKQITQKTTPHNIRSRA